MKLTREQIVAEIQRLETEISKLEAKDGKYGNSFPKILKMQRKQQRLMAKL